MVEYVLKNPVEAKRVEITKPPKPFALKTFDAQQDESVAEAAAPQDGGTLASSQWHAAVANGYESVSRELLINHDGMLQMLELWGLYEHLLLCSVNTLPLSRPRRRTVQRHAGDRNSPARRPPPARPPTPARPPLSAATPSLPPQHSHCEKVMQTLKKKWFPTQSSRSSGLKPRRAPEAAATATAATATARASGRCFCRRYRR